MATVQRWQKVYRELQQRSEKIGYHPPKIIGSGNSQVFEYRIGQRPVLLLAFRDLGQKEGHANPNRLWAEGLELVLKRYVEHERNGVAPLPQAAAIVIDNIGDAYVVVMLDELIPLYRSKGAFASRDSSRHFTFVVVREGNKYFLQRPGDLPQIELTNVNSIESLLLLLKSLKRRALENDPPNSTVEVKMTTV
jgi:hypothetical protein